MSGKVKDGSILHLCCGTGYFCLEVEGEIQTIRYGFKNGCLIECFTLHINQTTDGLLELPDAATATYCAVLDHLGEMYCGIGDMDILNKIEPDNVPSLVIV